MIGLLLKELGGSLLGGVTDYFKHKRDHKRAVQLAKIQRVNKLDTADVDWDRKMAEISETSCKDEWWTIVLSIPAIMAFIPSLAPYVAQGFKALSEAPDWYLISLATAIGAAFGTRKLSEMFKRKK